MNALAYGLVLLIVWTVGPALVGLSVWLLLRLAPSVNRRKLAVCLVPAFAALNRVYQLQSIIIFVLLLGYVAQGPASWSSPVGNVVTGSIEEHWAHYFLVPALATFWFSVLPDAYALPDRTQIPAATWYVYYLAQTVWLFSAAVLVQAGAAGPYASVVAVDLLLLAAFSGWLRLGMYAAANFAAAAEVTVVTPSPDIRVSDALFFIHLSDVHITTPPGAVPVGGGVDGTDELSAFVNDVARGARVPRFVFLTGDLVDRGVASEWKAGLDLLDRLRPHTRVVLAPGNHDLAPSYVVLDAVFATQASQQVDGMRLMDALEACSKTEPMMQTASGNSLAELVDRERRAATRLKELWNEGQKSPERLQRAATEIQDLFPRLSADEWRIKLQRIPLLHVDEGVLSPLWSRHWYEPFPLRLAVPEHSLEVFITNSTEPEARLAGSAIGGCGKQQIERLRNLVAGTAARNVLVLHHHAPFRWDDDDIRNRGGLLRWGTLAHEGSEAVDFLGALKAAPDGVDVFLLGGHRHDPSRCGQVVGHLSGGRTIKFLESGALGEAGAAVIPAGWFVDGRLDVGLIPRRAPAA